MGVAGGHDVRWEVVMVDRVVTFVRTVMRKIGAAYVKYEYEKEKSYIWEIYGD